MALAVVQIILFGLGLALGSFLHVLAARYDPERFILNHRTLGGRSHCPHCKKTLCWYELVPLFSFLVQRGRCRGCGAVIGWNYVWAELASGLIVALVPCKVVAMAAVYTQGAESLIPYLPQVIALAAVWTAIFLTLLLITLIDLRLQIIPDELVVLTGALGVAAVLLDGGIGTSSAEFWISYLGTAIGAALFFAALVAVTRGRGMGLGDVKLSFALGLLFIWPKVLLLVMLAFIFGAIIGLALIAVGRATRKSAVPFGPFLALAALAAFFYGDPLIYSFGLLFGW